uniref:Uncharacterized protein n=2 Tax=Rhizophora mucronata TaxID=61149 RepID=A0A2P2IQV7_RHIMU
MQPRVKPYLEEKNHVRLAPDFHFHLQLHHEQLLTWFHQGMSLQPAQHPEDVEQLEELVSFPVFVSQCSSTLQQFCHHHEQTLKSLKIKGKKK